VSSFKVVVGLGNPGPAYEKTRHNIGFLLLDRLLENLSGNISGWGGIGRRSASWKEKFGAAFVDVQYEGQKLFLLKPLKYMNLSGEPLSAFIRFYGVNPSEIIVAHDEVDLSFGTLRIKSGGGDAGHKGIRSIAQEIKTRDFVRLRLGVGRGLETAEGEESFDIPTDKWVLGQFSRQEEPVLDGLLDTGVEAVKELFVAGLKLAQNKYNCSTVATKE